MKKEDVFVTGLIGESEERARNLISSTLAPLHPMIEMAAVRFDYDGPSPECAFLINCTILVKLIGGCTLRSDVRDCDDLLALYKALSEIMDQVAATQTHVDLVPTEETGISTGPL